MPGSPHLARRFLRSIGAATFSQAWRVGVTFATHLVLRRLISPEDWGLFVWAEVVFLVLGAVRDLGMNGHVLRVRPRPFGNFLLLELVWGGALVLLGAVAAPWLAAGMAGQHPELVPVLRALTLFLFLEGVALVPLVWFEGELEVGRAVPAELLRNVCYAVTAVSLALAGKGVWALVVAQIVGSAVFALSLWSRATGRIVLHFERGATWRLLASSWRLALIWLLILLVRYVDRLVVGGLESAAGLGTYEFAYWAAFIVPMVVLQPVGRVAYPAFVALGSSRRRLFETYHLSTVALLCLEVPAALFLWLNADRVLELIGGEGWTGAPSLLRILCFAPLLDPFSRLGGEVLATRHRDWRWIAATTTTLLSFLLFGLLFTWRFGTVGMAWANYLPLGGVLMIHSLRRLAPRGVRRLFTDLLWVYLLPVPGFALVWTLFRWAAPTRPDLLLGVSLLAVAAAAALYWWRFGPQLKIFFGSGGTAGAGDPAPPPQ